MLVNGNGKIMLTHKERNTPKLGKIIYAQPLVPYTLYIYGRLDPQQPKQMKQPDVKKR